LKRELGKLIAGQVCLHACMAGMRMAAPLMALRAARASASREKPAMSLVMRAGHGASIDVGIRVTRPS
jgi:hypothetical protein